MMAGGTGGHVYPALAVAMELMDRGYRIEWLGTARGLEERVIPRAGIPLHHLTVRGVRGKNILHKLLGLVSLAIASVQALWLVLRLAPRCVVGMGGYASGPGGAAAWVLRKPLLIQEQNAVAGTTNRLLAPFARTVVAGFPGAFPAAIEYRVLGNPVRRELLVAGECLAYDYHGQRPLRLLVLGGSLGARPLNELVPSALRELGARTGSDLVEVWHQTGEAHLHTVGEAYAGLAGMRVRLGDFIDDMVAAYCWADLVICRAGALTVSELAIMGRPALLVPLPHAIDDHQSANARVLADVGAAQLLRQDTLDADRLVGILRELLADPQRLQAMAQAARAVARPEATRAVSDCCEVLINAG
jgi:UDP-N-acetylglucosamine--N-acetylmuramyl-(pentapeptide) pyrophosphoryl-undecaprenol N-acetylglucosamine transferase